jgi:hypothetical protein
MANEYANVGRFLGYKIENSSSICLKGLLTVEGKGYEVTLFYAADKDIEFAREKGWTEPFAKGNAKVNATKEYPVAFYINAIIPDVSGAIALKLSLSRAEDKEKFYLNLFYVKGSDVMLEGNVSAKVPF